MSSGFLFEPGFIMRFYTLFNRIIEWVGSLLMATVLGLVLLQVFYRYVMNDPIGWTQELSVYGTIIAVMLGSALAFRQNDHIAITFFVDLFPVSMRIFLTRLASVVSIIFLAILAFQSWKLAVRAMRQISPTTGIPNGFIIMSIVVGAVLCIVYLTIFLIKPKLHSIEDEVAAELNMVEVANGGE